MKTASLQRLKPAVLAAIGLVMMLAGASPWVWAADVSDAVEASNGPSTPAPDELVDGFHQRLVQLMQSAAPFAERERTIAPVIGDVFDLTAISRVSLGRATWKSLSREEREHFVGLLGQLISATYASRFDSYNNQRFEVRDLNSPREGRHVVKTELVRNNGERVTLDYYLSKNRVFNVVADGVSDLSLRRADYSAVIKQSGYPALLTQIEASIAEFRADD